MTREMKDSGIEWIGEIPKEWGIAKIKNIKDTTHPYPIGDGDHGSITPSMYKDEGIPYIRVQNLGWGTDLKLDDVVYISQEVNNANRKSWLYPGDILIAKTGGTIGKTALIPDSISIANTTSSVGKVTVSAEENNKYYFYVISSEICYKQMWSIANQKSAQPGINIIDIEKLSIPHPDKSEQDRISVFLDSKCSQIDSILTGLQDQIDTLEQYKKSVITEAVTKGLNADVEMKDSGIEWIGKIPKHWKIDKGKYIFKYQLKPVKEDDGVITCFRDGEVTLRTNRRTEGFTESLKEFGYQGIDVGDLIVHGMDGFAGSIGISDSRGKASPVLNNLDTDYNKRYYMYLLRMYAWKGVFVSLATGIRVRTCDTNWGKLKELPYVVFDKNEQQQIVDYLDTKCSQIDSIISQKKELIEILKEYKKSLIYEYVTGKKEVPNA